MAKKTTPKPSAKTGVKKTASSTAVKKPRVTKVTKSAAPKLPQRPKAGSNANTPANRAANRAAGKPATQSLKTASKLPQRAPIKAAGKNFPAKVGETSLVKTGSGAPAKIPYMSERTKTVGTKTGEVSVKGPKTINVEGRTVKPTENISSKSTKLLNKGKTLNAEGKVVTSNAGKSRLAKDAIKKGVSKAQDKILKETAEKVSKDALTKVGKSAAKKLLKSAGKAIPYVGAAVTAADMGYKIGKVIKGGKEASEVKKEAFKESMPGSGLVTAAELAGAVFGKDKSKSSAPNKSKSSTKSYTSKSGTKTTVVTDKSGKKTTKVIAKDGTIYYKTPDGKVKYVGDDRRVRRLTQMKIEATAYGGKMRKTKDGTVIVDYPTNDGNIPYHKQVLDKKGGLTEKTPEGTRYWGTGYDTRGKGSGGVYFKDNKGKVITEAPKGKRPSGTAKDAYGRPPGSKWYGFNEKTKKFDASVARNKSEVKPDTSKKTNVNSPKPATGKTSTTKPITGSSNKPSTTKAKTGSTAKKSTATTKPVVAKTKEQEAAEIRAKNSSLVGGRDFSGKNYGSEAPRLAPKKVTSVGSAPTATIETPKTSSTVLSEKMINSKAIQAVNALNKSGNDINTVTQAVKAVAPTNIAPEQKVKLKDKIKNLFNKSK